MNKPKALLIAEKPSLMRDIKNAYEHCQNEIDYDIDFVAQVGHLVELYDPVELNPLYKDWKEEYLPINPDNEGGWKYKVIRSVRDVYSNIESAIKSGKYDYIIHAGDPDQEGELLVNLVLQKIGNTLPVLRFWSNDTTQVALENALKNLKDDTAPEYVNLLNAARIRQHADWLFGINGSRGIAARIYSGRENKIAAGRVMTWVLTAIVDREDEIKNFIPKTVYGVKIQLDTPSGVLPAQLYEPQTNETEKPKKDNKEEDESTGYVYFKTKNEADNFINKLTNIGTISSIKTERMTTYAPKLYKLATIQSEAARAYGYTSGETLEIIQSLYEKHLVSYPRTDCEVLSSNENLKAIISSAAAIPEYVSAANIAVTKISKVLKIKKYINDKELQKHGHSALVPTSCSPDLGSLTDKEINIYKMIARRFLSIFEDPLIQDKTTVITDVDGYKFRTSGKIVIDKGFTTFLGISVKDAVIPAVNENDKFPIIKKEVTDKTSVCPKRFTEGTIIDAMENPSKYLSDITIKDSVEDLKIGTSATRGDIIKKLEKNKYIEAKNNILSPTDFGTFMIHTIRGISLCRVDTTGEWEILLSKVKSGEMSEEDAYNYVKEQLDILLKDIKGINKVSYGSGGAREAIMTCPACGKNIYESTRNYYCEGYRDGCKTSMMKEILGAKISKEDAIALFSGKTIKKKLTKKDKSASWEQVLKYDPEAEWNPVFVQNEEEQTNFECPECHRALLKRKGKKVYCECGFSIWTSPAHRDLTDSELDYIFKHGQSDGKISGLKGSKKNFSANLILQCKGCDSKFDFKF